VTVLERLYRGVLLLYPRSFRRSYGAEMIAALQAREADPHYAASRLGRLRLYALVAEDVLRSLPREHRAARRAIFRIPRPDWTMDTLRQDLHFAARTLVSRPAFSLAIIATLALGIGATTTIFSVLDGVVLRALPYPQDSSLVMLGSHTDRVQEFGPISPFAFAQWLQHNEVFETMAASYRQDMDLTGSGEPERLRVAGVSPDYFRLLGATPSIGRGLLEADDVAGATPVVVLRNGLWQRRWGGDPAVVGDTIFLDGVSHTVVGVLPPGFMPPEAMGHQDLDAWVPLRQTSIDTFDRGNFNLRVLARLRPGTSLATAREAMSSLAWALNRDAVPGGTGTPAAQESAAAGGADANDGVGAGGTATKAEGETARQLSIRFDKDGIQVADAEASPQVAVVSLRELTVGNSATGLLVLSGAVAFLLLIACANVASLQLTRAQDRAREIAVRFALGAGRRRLVRQMLTENVLVALTGGALGVIVALAGVKLFVGLNPGDLPRLQQVSVDLRTLGFALLVSLCAGTAFGIAPALQLIRGACAESLKEALPGASPGARRQRMRGLVVALETALALVLLIGAGLLLNSFVRLTSVDPGFEPSNATVMRIQLGDGYPEPAERAQFFRRLLERVRSLPGVESAGAASLLPFSQRYDMSSFEPEMPLEDPGVMNLAGFHEVSASFHHTLGTHLTRGRSFFAGRGDE